MCRACPTSSQNQHPPHSHDTTQQPIKRDRKGEIPEGGKPYFVAPMVTITDGAFSWQYDSTYVTLAPRHAGVPALTPERLELLELVRL